MLTNLPRLLLSAWLFRSTTAIVVDSIADDLVFSSMDQLVNHTLVYTPGCVDVFDVIPTAYGFVRAELTGKAAELIFGGDDTSVCRAACLERGTSSAVAHAVMPHHLYDRSSSHREVALGDWFSNKCVQVEVCLINYFKGPDTSIQTRWVNHRGEPQLHLRELKYGERNTRCFNSYIGHTLQAVSNEGELIHEFVVEYTTTLAIGTAFPSGHKQETRDFDGEIRSTLQNEWKKHNEVERTFSPLGFDKGRLPLDIFASMQSFLNNNAGNKVDEEWGGKGVFVNWWETSVSFIQIPWELKRKWQLRLLELVQAWAGVPIEQTDMYGLRQYEAGARLLTHVDRITTHSVSLIVNIAQGNLTEPWPVEVFDHADRLHEVPMQPGDVVYYESAKCLHSRNRPLRGPGAYYVNLFTHYRPTGDPNWYSKPNPEGTPSPLLDVEGSCQVAPSRTLATAANGQLGVVNTVQCDDPRLGRYISPTLYTASSGDDLIHWWEMTSPLAEEEQQPVCEDKSAPATQEASSSS